jgi:hypothetical protein
MRKLKLQMQVTVDGCVAGPEGHLGWMTFDMDPRLLILSSRDHCSTRQEIITPRK